LKILIASIRDTGGTGYMLAHAINKVTPEHHAINMRGQKSYINYPTIVDMGDYSVATCRKMIYKADVLVFLSAVQPLFQGLQLRKRYLKGKKILLYETGTIWRYARRAFMEEADKLIGNYQVVLGGSDQFLPGEDEEKTPCPSNAKYLPICRSFSELRRRFSICRQDQAALEAFAIPKKMVSFAHAPTSEVKKGSNTFYRVVTQAMQLLPQLAFTMIRRQTWVATLKILSACDVLLDQDPPWPMAYGGLTVEASVFKLPVVTRMNPDCQEWLLKKTGLKTPFITWGDDEDLLQRLVYLTEHPEVRAEYGRKAYQFCKELHDERVVVERFFKILEEMN